MVVDGVPPLNPFQAHVQVYLCTIKSRAKWGHLPLLFMVPIVTVLATTLLFPAHNERVSEHASCV
jgi:hypothetical protein